MNYTEIQAEIKQWVHRTNADADIRTCIARAENEIFRELSVREIEASISGTTSGDALTFPAGAAAIERIEIQARGVKFTLSYTSPNGIELLTSSTNVPSRFLIEKELIRLIAAPAGNYSYTIFYIPLLTPLTESATTNWLSINHPDLYTKAAMYQFGMFSVDGAMVLQWKQPYLEALDSVRRSDEGRRFPIAGGLQIKVRNAR